MKVLIVSHNVFSTASNMGKTLHSYFSGFGDYELGQFYIHSEIPTDRICQNYFRITDIEMLRSILSRRSGQIFRESDVVLGALSPRTDTGNTAKLYQKARRRTPLVYMLRNLWWFLGVWNTKLLRKWLDDFDPDIVFFASGDYAFMYKIARHIATSRRIPLAVVCMDDYYIHNKNAGKLGGRFMHMLFMRQVHKTMDYSSCVFTICEKMATDYQRLFGTVCHVLHTAASIQKPLDLCQSNAISYIGNLGYDRDKQLVAIGRALKSLPVEGKPDFIDVYTAERNPEKLKNLVEENGIKYHGAIPSDEVLRVMGRSLAVIHTESFDEHIQKSVAYSVSTKIADSLASGTCIFAYGPENVASIQYLSENSAAFCITSESRLSAGLSELIQNKAARNTCVTNALRLAEKNHDPNKTVEMVYHVLSNTISPSQDQR